MQYLHDTHVTEVGKTVMAIIQTLVGWSCESAASLRRSLRSANKGAEASVSYVSYDMHKHYAFSYSVNGYHVKQHRHVRQV